MKQISFFILLVILFVTCKRPCSCEKFTDRPCICYGEYTVDQRPCFCVKFKGKIGNDFESGLDSLKKWYESEILPTEGLYSGKGYFIRKEIINVDYPHDDREFFRIYFIDSVHTYLYLALSDVIDDNGNHYMLITAARD